MNEPAIDSSLSLNLPIAAGATTDVGQREENQDCITGFMAPCGAVYLVADGMGGHSGGAEASRMVADGMRRHLRSLPQSTPVGDALSLAARLTNVEMLTRSSADPNLAGMGSTVAIALVRAFENGMELIAAHAGDSRVYLHRAGQLALLTRDDTQVQWMVDRHLIDEARARTHPDSSVLTKAMGHSADLDIEVSEPIPLLEGDGILLCSDGLSGFASAEEINRVILQTPQPVACARELVKLALDKGSDDNISVQFLRVGITAPAGVTVPIDSSQPRDSRPAAPRMRLASGLALALALAAFVTWRSGFFPALFASPVTLRIEGSTTVGDELVPALVKAFLEHEGAAKIEVIRSSTNKGKIEIGGVLPGQSRQVFSVMANGSANAFTALAANNAQVGMASRRIRDDEAKNLSALGDMKSPACEHIVALDGIAIVVNVGNAVQSLTKSQVASVFQGKVLDWGNSAAVPVPSTSMAATQRRGRSIPL